MDAGWMQDACRMDVGWMQGGCGMDTGWVWGGCGVDVGWIWGGYGVDARPQQGWCRRHAEGLLAHGSVPAVFQPLCAAEQGGPAGQKATFFGAE